MNSLKTGVIISTVLASLGASVYAQAASDSKCYVVYSSKYKEPAKITPVVKKPVEKGVVGKEYILDASSSITPSGKKGYKWAVGTGGYEFAGPTDQATVKIKSDRKEGVDAVYSLTVSDPDCPDSPAGTLGAEVFTIEKG
ncbi:hypothetical protein J3P84_12390 [Pseudomonas sp. Z1-29]|uniref:hypothetical protein n=1 Tax=unclassified Pseudomonas TaxID=196821 RepID=UPI003DA81E41